jgi:hypothetical protein
MGAHYRHTTPEMAARVVGAIQARPSVVVTTAVRDRGSPSGPGVTARVLTATDGVFGRVSGKRRFGVLRAWSPPPESNRRPHPHHSCCRAPVIEDAEVKWPEVSVADRGEPVASCSQWHQLGRWARPVPGDTSSIVGRPPRWRGSSTTSAVRSSRTTAWGAGEIPLDRRTAVRGALPLREEVVRPQRTAKEKARSYALLATPNL